jgi:predicted ATPase
VPLPMPSFIGRVSDVERTLELLARPSHMVTLLGPAGIGKTRLALRVVDEAENHQLFDTTWFVALAEARSETALVSSVAAALGDLTDDVGHALASRERALVVLDNVEQIAASAAAAISRWAHVAPRACFLVTSRERLRIKGEVCLELEPLGRDDAVRLFVERAAAARGRFAPDGSDLEAIAELVRRLDGNPLAIELAAARTKLFSPSELLVRIDRRFDLLIGRTRDSTVRQGSLRGAIDWSWDLLSESEKRALARCAVFSGGFSVEAAEALLGDGLAALESIVDKSLVRRRDARLSLDEMVRDYASLRLAELGEEYQARDRHAEIYAAFATTHAAALSGGHARAAVARLRAETDNVLAAHGWLRGRDPRAAAAVALALNTLLAIRGPIDMQRELISAAITDAEGDHALHVRALVASAQAHIVRGDAAAAEVDANRALDALQTRGNDDALDASLRALALGARARIDAEIGRSERARTSADEALRLCTLAHDRMGEAGTLSLCGGVALRQGRIDEARGLFERALVVQSDGADSLTRLNLLINLAGVHILQDRLDEARRSYQAAYELAVAFGDRHKESVVALGVGQVLMDEGLSTRRARSSSALSRYSARLGPGNTSVPHWRRSGCWTSSRETPL